MHSVLRSWLMYLLHQKGWGKRQRGNSRLPKKHPFRSGPEPFWTTCRHLKKFKVSDFRDISVILTAPHSHSSSLSLSMFFLFARKANIVCLLFIVSQTCFNKKHLCIARQSSYSYHHQKKIQLNCINPPTFMDLSKKQHGHGRTWQSKQSEVNVVVTNTTATSTVTSSHTILGTMTSIGPHLVPFKPGSILSKLHGPTTPYTRPDPDKSPTIVTPHPGSDREKSLQHSPTQKNIVTQRKSTDSG